ncbi:hypothetical protein O0L34_g14590 [Tuta absoluta]|nr:hypothetical protein O0L34_g14590 [Tuta absoluta]
MLKVHPKSASKSKQTPHQAAVKAEAADTEVSPKVDYEAAREEFNSELAWCIEQLERFVVKNKNTKTPINDTEQALMILKSEEEPIIFKRMLMTSYCGDYATKIKAGRNPTKTNKMKLPFSVENKSSILRKTATDLSDKRTIRNVRLTIKTSVSKTSTNTSSSSKSFSTKVSGTSVNIIPSGRKTNSARSQSTAKSTASYNRLMEAASLLHNNYVMKIRKK